MRRPTVLLVDDDEWMAARLAARLKKAGFDIVLARDGIEAIEQINSAIPDVLILDIFMPGPNGIVLLNEIASHTDLAGMPIIICSSSAGELELSDLKKYGVTKLVDKLAMEADTIVTAVRGVLM